MAKVKDAKMNGSAKDGRVTKPAAKLDSKKIAKEATAKMSKKAKKAPTPEPESDDGTSDSGSDAESASDSGSDSSVSSDSEAEVAPKLNGSAKVGNGVKPHDDSEGSDDDSEGSDDSDSASDSDASSDDEQGPHTSKAAQVGQKSAAADDDSSENDDSDESDDDIKPQAKAGKGEVASKVVKTNGAVSSDDESDEGSDEGSDDDSEGSSEDASEEEEVAAKPEPTKKRKADVVEETFSKKAKASDNSAEQPVANLFVGNLSWNVDEEWLTREFEEFGEIAGCRIITDRESGRSKGFGYVTFTTTEEAKAAYESKKVSLLDGRPLNVDYSTPRAERGSSDFSNRGERVNNRASQFGDAPREPSATLWVGNVSFNATSEIIGEAFGEYGTVTRVALPTDMETGALKGYGYVDFTTTEEASAAFDALNGAEIAGRSIRLDYASPRTGGGDRGGFRGGRGDRGGRGGRGGFNDRGGRGGGRGGFGGRGGGRGGFGDRGGRGGFSKNRGGVGDFSGKKVTF